MAIEVELTSIIEGLLHAALYASLLVVMGSCEGSSESFFDAAHVRLYYAADHPPCEGSARYLSDVAAAQSALLGLPLPSPTIAYHFATYSVVQAHCVVNDSGCYLGSSGEIWSGSADSAYEIAAVVVHASLKALPAFFEVGVAVALGEYEVDDPPDYSIVPQALMQFDDSRVAFATAGDFVSYLISRYGPQSLVAFLRQIDGAHTTDPIEAAFESVYGQTIAQAFSDRMSSGLTFTENRLWLPECSGTPVPWSGGVASASAPIACDGNGIGALSDASIRRQVLFEAQAAGGYVLTQDSNSSTSLTLHRCDSGTGFTSTFGTPYSDINPHALVAVYLQSGRYATIGSLATMYASATAPAPFSLSLSPSASVSPDCAQITPLTIDPATTDLLLSPDSGQSLAWSFELQRSLRGNLWGVGVPSIGLCAGACMSSCPSPSSFGTGTSFAASTVYTLTATPTNPSASIRVQLFP